ncbi:neurofilament heavy polypeptide-like [Helianthus annuus]|uniref:neurofilament heavy polypeptide-like n=1 Tax=Helianthus annuus TaxID=4232 RepID=UPI000B8F271B|nr:neurofilament heavy polypeptide-like [Helianthus annuus]
MDKESMVSKTLAKEDDPILDESRSAAQTSVAEPTAPVDHDTTAGVVKPTLAKSKKKPATSKKPTKTKQNKAGPLEDEIPEVQDTQADIKAIKEHLVKITGSAPTTIIQDDDDDAKKREKYSLRRLQPDSKAKPKPKVQQKSESAQPKTSVKTLEARKEKGIDETLNKMAEEIVLEKHNKQDTKESKALQI